MKEKRYKNTKSQTNFSMQNSQKIAEFKCKFTTFAKSFFDSWTTKLFILAKYVLRSYLGGGGISVFFYLGIQD